MKITFFLLLILTLSQSCMDRLEGKLQIVNHSKQKVYLGQLITDNYSLEISRDVRDFCLGDNDPVVFPRILNPNDSTFMLTKYNENQVIYSLNVEFLEQICNNKHNNPALASVKLFQRHL